jgi:hypothetical protein
VQCSAVQCSEDLIIHRIKLARRHGINPGPTAVQCSAVERSAVKCIAVQSGDLGVYNAKRPKLLVTVYYKAAEVGFKSQDIKIGQNYLSLICITKHFLGGDGGFPGLVISWPVISSYYHHGAISSRSWRTNILEIFLHGRTDGRTDGRS